MRVSAHSSRLPAPVHPAGRDQHCGTIGGLGAEASPAVMFELPLAGRTRAWIVHHDGWVTNSYTATGTLAFRPVPGHGGTETLRQAPQPGFWPLTSRCVVVDTDKILN